MKNKVRIIAGYWRSRQIKFDDAPGLRPTPSRVRETVFNWLQNDITNSRCLDLFAGSGALGFEAASRGASRVVLVESNQKTAQCLRSNITLLAANQVSLVVDTAEHFLHSYAETFDLVFLDPPFGQNMLSQSCHLLENNGWLSSHAKIYLELEKGLVLKEMPVNWRLLKQNTAGDVTYLLFVRDVVLL